MCCLVWGGRGYSWRLAGPLGATLSTRAIAVAMPNSGTINSDWRTHRTSVDQVEALTGFDLFSNVPAATQAAIESSVDA